ncbi:uncharacterized protein BCR38DRAFT_331613 [Pseudomassariella vexata]|uniref:DUF6594 domain-containing protein n=1 Tax=Pseudomassariella vexata TaxID=1141098 RepID=A0A1Y2EKM2_9PEZI|nr:uncharacterized protein BCR38DRAFT_331613 [Pseudomassariella vexata]ORY72088.1 hypothetical protein BCR38DRAFT_331613 [Pseudomassariella vexata]
MEGYAKVVDLMATHQEFAITRRFRALNMQNVLYLQAEIMHLDYVAAYVFTLATRDATHPARQFHCKDWWSLANGSEQEDRQQWEKILEIRQKLATYNATVLQQAQMAKLDTPSKYDVEFLRTWFKRPLMGAFPLLGLDQTAWDEDNQKDLIAIRARKSPDMFSKWFTEVVVPTFHHLVGERLKKHDSVDPGIYEYNEKLLAKILFGISTVIASMLPICSIVVLYYVQSSRIQLGLTVLFCACFSSALVLMTNAKKVEIFAATAAFAAVDVVFLTSDSHYSV